jgi:hypothetical protein
MAMNEKIEFALKGEAAGAPISPQNVPFGQMKKFHEEVEQLILGSNDGSLNDVIVTVKEGSYGLVVPIPESVRESFDEDMEAIENPNLLRSPDPERFEIVARWQAKAIMEGSTYTVRPTSTQARFNPLVITKDTKLRKPEDDQFHDVELMLLGTVIEAGGRKTNLHIKYPTTRNQLSSRLIAAYLRTRHFRSRAKNSFASRLKEMPGQTS